MSDKPTISRDLAIARGAASLGIQIASKALTRGSSMERTRYHELSQEAAKGTYDPIIENELLNPWWMDKPKRKLLTQAEYDLEELLNEISKVEKAHNDPTTNQESRRAIRIKFYKFAQEIRDKQS